MLQPPTEQKRVLVSLSHWLRFRSVKETEVHIKPPESFCWTERFRRLTKKGRESDPLFLFGIVDL
jgi:hypothetical protein